MINKTRSTSDVGLPQFIQPQPIVRSFMSDLYLMWPISEWATCTMSLSSGTRIQNTGPSRHSQPCISQAITGREARVTAILRRSRDLDIQSGGVSVNDIVVSV